MDKFPIEYHGCLDKLKVKLQLEEAPNATLLSGISGSNIFLFKGKKNGGSFQPLFIKCGPSESIRSDLERSKEAFANFLLTDYRIESVGCGAYSSYSITMGKVDVNDIQTFEEFYKSHSPEEIVGLLRELFEGTLRKKNLNKEKGENIFAYYDLPNGIVLEPELRLAKRKYPDSPSLLFWFKQAAGLWPHASTCIFSHGGIHRRNVIVSGSTPYMVSFEHSGMLPVMYDIAKMIREIHLFLYLKGSKKPEEDSKKLDEVYFLDKSSTPDYKDNSELGKAVRAIQYLLQLAEKSVDFKRDDYWKEELNGALLAEFLFAAGDKNNPDLRVRRIAYRKADELRNWFECKNENFAQKINEKISEQRRALDNERKNVLWKIAYLFLRLDQIPEGGWGKTLVDWMEAIWEGDDGGILRDPVMRKHGDTDSTCCAINLLQAFLKNKVAMEYKQKTQLRRILEKSQALIDIKNSLKYQMAPDGGMGGGYSGKGGERYPIRIRHTAAGAIAFLRIGEATELIPRKLLEDSINYLHNNLKHWDGDNSHHFALFAFLVKLTELLKCNMDIQKQAQPLQHKILDTLPDIWKSMDNYEYYAKPENTHDIKLLANPFFIPSGNFWRMERSDFLTYLPFLITEDGRSFIDVFNDPQANIILCKRYARCIEKLLDDIATPFNEKTPAKSLLYFHQEPKGLITNSKNAAQLQWNRDWGISAQFLAALKTPAVEDLLKRKRIDFKNKREALEKALLSTFDLAHFHQELFKYTNGLTFASYLGSLDNGSIEFTHFYEEVEEKIERLFKNGGKKNRGLSEKDIQLLIEKEGIFKHFTDDCSQIFDPIGIRNFYINKFAPGEFLESWWSEESKENTIEFYEDEVGKRNAKFYGPKPIESFVSRISDFVTWESFKGKKALDLGCGYGQYAKLLKEKGFEVTLYDASQEMLDLASEHTGIAAPHIIKGDVFKLEEPQLKTLGPFDLIFACAIMVHVPKKMALDIYRKLYSLLKPDGLFFVNFKIKDHSLVSEGNRFFEYYSSYTIPQNMIRSVGFKESELTLRWNNTNMYGRPLKIHWANFYFTKELSL